MKKRFSTSIAITMILLLLFAVLCFVACDNKTDNVGIVFDSNGGNGQMDTISATTNTEIVLTKNTFARDGYEFVGWATTDNGDVVYEDGATIQTDNDITLYAVWTKTQTLISATKKDNKTLTVGLDDVSEPLGKAEIAVYHGNYKVKEMVVTDSATLDSGTIDIEGLFGGNFTVKVKLYSRDLSESESLETIGSIALDELNFGFLAATFPVSLFTLMMADTDSVDIDSTADTYVWLSRNKAYNWDCLLENMYAFPLVDCEKEPTDSTWTEAYNAAKDWIKELYTLNTGINIKLYFTDLYMRIPCDFLIENDIPTANWTAYMFSDGSGTAGCLKQLYNIENPQARYDEQAAAWNAYLVHKDRTQLPYYDWEMLNYMYVAFNEMPDNFKWYTGRMRTTENVILQDATFADNLVNGTKTIGRKEFYLNNLLNALSAEEKANFKELYHIDDATFAAATDNDKKIMMILGTSWDGEGADLEHYIRIAVEIYGDDYVYYYKGHPGYPTSDYPGRKEILDKLVGEGKQIYELDNTVAAEFFLFFFDDIEMIGYQSTTFASGTDQNAAGVFGNNQASGYYADLLETYIAKINDNAEYMASHSGVILGSDDYFAIEVVDEMASEYDLAIYSTNTKEISYYKLNAEIYQKID